MKFKVLFSQTKYFEGTIEAENEDEVRRKFDDDEIENVYCGNSEMTIDEIFEEE